ncbi:hypothetical protein IU474_18655 [Nocardia otitidiscaviarum]|nr:hypothetical protein [Nocardia otitidiscaviarum]MBF6239073.1 hypothetical protein [Nocardia otitidiscaviarum]
MPATSTPTPPRTGQLTLSEWCDNLVENWDKAVASGEWRAAGAGGQ